MRPTESHETANGVHSHEDGRLALSTTESRLPRGVNISARSRDAGKYDRPRIQRSALSHDWSDDPTGDQYNIQMLHDADINACRMFLVRVSFEALRVRPWELTKLRMTPPQQ